MMLQYIFFKTNFWTQNKSSELGDERANDLFSFRVSCCWNPYTSDSESC